jgi:hypothetical protein
MEPEEEVRFSLDMDEEIPVDDNDIRLAAEESGEVLPAAMLRRNARTLNKGGGGAALAAGGGTSSAPTATATGSAEKSSSAEKATPAGKKVTVVVPPLSEDARGALRVARASAQFLGVCFAFDQYVLHLTITQGIRGGS